MHKNWHENTLEKVFIETESRKNGLTTSETTERLKN
jgi:hypothetical protein